MSEMTRKEFLRGILASGQKLVAAVEWTEPPTGDPVLAALAADFPDALLREEAGRLGLDPAKTGREEMLRAVAAAMRPPAPPQGG